MEEKDLKAKILAEKIIKNTRDGIMLKMKFLDSATNNLKLETNDIIPISTDGKRFLYNDYFVINAYKTNINWINRAYVHSMLHCVLKHMYQSKMVNRTLWDLACDICVENIINNMNNPLFFCGKTNEQLNVINNLKKTIKYITAERIYECFLSANISKNDILQMQLLFAFDNHNLWYIPPKDKDSNGDDNSNGDENQQTSSMQNIISKALTFAQLTSDILSSNNSLQGICQMQNGSNSSSSDKWTDIANSLKVDIETFSKSIGTQSADLIDNLKEVTREKYDYTEFLQKFAVRNEVMKINDDEFDYIFYTYGLNLYKNVPLIEPLEYKDVKQIKEFVIAIDTSGSTSGELVKTFLNKTFNILSSTDNIASKTKIQLIQCDSEIKDVITITKQSDIEQYMKNFKIHGGGGTSFVPVFKYVDNLIKGKFFYNLKGMIYFTDGYGEFPKKKPNYDVSFVFIEGDDFNDVDVPSWAIKLILKPKDILE